MYTFYVGWIKKIQPNHDSFWGKTLAYLAELLRGRENVFEYNYRIKDFVTSTNKCNNCFYKIYD